MDGWKLFSETGLVIIGAYLNVDGNGFSKMSRLYAKYVDSSAEIE